MGAAGISCSAGDERQGKMRMKINLDKSTLAQKGMTAYEIMLSESQENAL